MTNISFLNILPFIWISYFVNQDITSQNKMNSINTIQKFIKIHNFTKIVRFDQETIFWNLKNDYISDIKKTLEEKNREKLKSIYNKYIKLIKTNYEQGIKTLLICPINNELIIGLLILFFKEITDLPISKIYNSIISKFESDTNINITENLKKILINK